MKTILSLTPSRRANLRLVFFPYAGGHVWQVWNWARQFPQEVELLGVRYAECASVADGRTAQSIARSTVEDVARLDDRPLIFFGYSLGALIAFEVCGELASAGLQMPAHLVVAASRAPSRAPTRPPASHLADAELIEELRRYQGTPELILQDKSVIELLLPSIRADLAIAERYRSLDAVPLACPITAICGSKDELAPPADVAIWKSHTSRAFDLQTIEGGHFFLHDKPGALIAIIRALTDRLA
jgi:medium-chain acyl-[acyl-carrier-protein] hydrolase